ncbi:unnamed protein product, partial [Ixodes hexagonus]
VAAVAVRLPPYWDRNPRVWFIQAESQFQLAGITNQGRKYHHVVSALSPTAADEVYDVISNPSPTTSYDQLKEALLQRTGDSERSRWQQLLSSEELGDRRPTQLLRCMTQLLGERANAIDDVLLRELFLQRLPPNVQMVLAAAAPLNLAELAGFADAVMETHNTPPACIEQLCQRLDQAILAATNRRDYNRSPSRRRRSTSRRPDNDTSRRGQSTGLCYYHRRFGPDSRRCQRPCTWSENRPADR